MSIDLVTAVASRALDGLHLRQLATAQNVANASSPGYTPLRVSFEAALRDAVAVRTDDNDADRLARVRRVRADVGTPLPIDSNTVRLDDEIASASETAAQYSMLIGLLDRTMQIRQLAIKGA